MLRTTVTNTAPIGWMALFTAKVLVSVHVRARDEENDRHG